MVKIGNKPILIHIMERYARYNHKDFILALGYKKERIKQYFKKNQFKDWKIKLIDTGLNSLTGTRLLKLKNLLIDEQSFFLTYGDGVANINLNQLLKFHQKSKNLSHF